MSSASERAKAAAEAIARSRAIRENIADGDDKLKDAVAKAGADVKEKLKKMSASEKQEYQKKMAAERSILIAHEERAIKTEEDKKEAGLLAPS